MRVLGKKQPHDDGIYILKLGKFWKLLSSSRCGGLEFVAWQGQDGCWKIAPWQSAEAVKACGEV